ncbi:MAG: hypothetical protein AAFY72_13525 [Cyanobacteria bacterium J06649_4]
MLTSLKFQQSVFPPVFSSTEKETVDMSPNIPSIPTKTLSSRVERTVSQQKFGRVVFQGVSWRAKCIQNRRYLPGVQVKVLYQQDNSLWVDTLPASALNPPA